MIQSKTKLCLLNVNHTFRGNEMLFNKDGQSFFKPLYRSRKWVYLLSTLAGSGSNTLDSVESCLTCSMYATNFFSLSTPSTVREETISNFNIFNYVS